MLIIILIFYILDNFLKFNSALEKKVENNMVEFFEKIPGEEGLLCGTNDNVCRVDENNVNSCCPGYYCVLPEGNYQYKICVDKDRLATLKIKGDIGLPSMPNGINIPNSFNMGKGPNINGPNINIPNINGPNINGPNINGPDMPDMPNMPNINIPNINGPNINGPNINGPNINIPNINMPNINMPNITNESIFSKNYWRDIFAFGDEFKDIKDINLRNTLQVQDICKHNKFNLG